MDGLTSYEGELKMRTHHRLSTVVIRGDLGVRGAACGTLRMFLEMLHLNQIHLLQSKPIVQHMII